MKCPYCHHPLEPLVINGRHTGAFQCIRCRGSWLLYHQFGGLIGAGAGSGVTALTRAAPDGSSLVPLAGGFEGRPSPWQSEPASNSSPWQALGGQSGQPSGGRAAAPPKKRSWWRKGSEEGPPPANPDWDLCTYCGQLHPGPGANCVHCNIERMRCPQCGASMVGVRRFQVLVDLCVGCQGLFFEKGRLELLFERLRNGELEALDSGDEDTSSSPSLLQQLAAFLEDTEPDRYSVGNRESTSVLNTVASVFSAGLGGGKQVLYDFLTLLGDVPTTRGKPRKPPGNDSR